MRLFNILTLVMMLTIASCAGKGSQKEAKDAKINDGPSEDLIIILHNYNQQAPQQLSSTVTMEKATFDFHNRMFEYNFSEIMPEGASIDEAQAQLNAMRLTTIEDQLRHDNLNQNRDFLKQLVKDNYGLRVRYIIKPTNDTIQSDVLPHEIDSLLNTIK